MEGIELNPNRVSSALKLAVVVAITVLSAMASVESQQELEQSLQSRYPPAVIGKGVMGIGSAGAIRRAGATVALRRTGLWGSLDRAETAAWAIRADRCELLTGHKDVEIQTGQQFYVTSVRVGLDVVQMGLLSVGPVSSAGRTGRLWAIAAFFFDPKVIAQGDMATIEASITQWLGQGSTASPSVAPAVASPVAPASPVRAETPATRSELKVGMTREQVVTAAGAPLSETNFATRTWLTYPGMVVMLEDGKLAAVDRSLQPAGSVSVQSDPPGAELFLDGKFLGNTPAKLQLSPGTYALVLKLQSYAPWQRELSVISGSETEVQAKLEAAGSK
jgi:hypothetical protein